MSNLNDEKIEHYRRQIWGQVTRGLFGVIRLLQQYEDGDLPDAPTNDFRLAAEQLRSLAFRIDGKGHADNSFSFSKPKT